jgi:hypothetical protein
MLIILWSFFGSSFAYCTAICSRSHNGSHRRQHSSFSHIFCFITFPFIRNLNFLFRLLGCIICPKIDLFWLNILKFWAIILVSKCPIIILWFYLLLLILYLFFLNFCNFFLFYLIIFHFLHPTHKSLFLLRCYNFKHLNLAFLFYLLINLFKCLLLILFLG